MTKTVRKPNTDDISNLLVMVFAEENPASKHSNCTSLHPDTRIVRMLNPAPARADGGLVQSR
jgi:hypothetical protein